MNRSDFPAAVALSLSALQRDLVSGCAAQLRARDHSLRGVGPVRPHIGRVKAFADSWLRSAGRVDADQRARCAHRRAVDARAFVVRPARPVWHRADRRNRGGRVRRAELMRARGGGLASLPDRTAAHPDSRGTADGAWKPGGARRARRWRARKRAVTRAAHSGAGTRHTRRIRGRPASACALGQRSAARARSVDPAHRAAQTHPARTGASDQIAGLTMPVEPPLGNSRLFTTECYESQRATDRPMNDTYS